MAGDRGYQMDMFGPVDETTMVASSTPILTASGGWQMAESAAFVATLRRGSLNDALGVINRLKLDTAWKVLLEAGFTVGTDTDRATMMAPVQKDIIEAAQRSMTGHELRVFREQESQQRESVDATLGAVELAQRGRTEGRLLESDQKSRADTGGEIGVNGYFYKGGQFLPSTEAEPGRWKVGNKWVSSGRELVAPGVFAHQPTPFSRSLFLIAGVGNFTQIADDGRLILNPGASGQGVLDHSGTLVTGDTMIRPGVKGVLGKEELKLSEIIDAWNAGQRWFDVQPNTQTITTEVDRENPGPAFSLSRAEAATERVRPKTAIVFDKPIVGPSGALMLQYAWQWKPFEFVDARGEDRVGRMSDWDKSETSVETGREVVHQFAVQMPNGTVNVVSAESAMQLLGFDNSPSLGQFKSVVNSSKTLARLQMRLAEVRSAREAFGADWEAIGNLPLPAIEWGEAGAGSSGRVHREWRMGDAWVRQLNDASVIEPERERTLVGSWQRNRMTERGWPAGMEQYQLDNQISDLERRAERAERRVKELAATQLIGQAAKAKAAQQLLTGTEDTALKSLQETTVRFASGMSAISDLNAGAHARAGHQNGGVGVDVGLLSKNGIEALAHAIVNWRTKVFIDSGAFSNFRKGVKSDGVEPLDFDAIMTKYDAIQEAITSANPAEDWDYPRPILVMPDVVGDQAASLALVEKYKQWISAETQFNTSTPIVPIQKGELTLEQAYRQVVATLGTDNFVVGLPSNAKAISREELAVFMGAVTPRRVHFLGAAAASNLDPLLAIVANRSPDTEVTADASQIRNTILTNVKAGMSRNDAIRDALHDKTDPLIAPYYADDPITTLKHLVKDGVIEGGRALYPEISRDVYPEEIPKWRSVATERTNGWMFANHEPWLDSGESRFALIADRHLVQFAYRTGDAVSKDAAEKATRLWAAEHPAKSFTISQEEAEASRVEHNPQSENYYDLARKHGPAYAQGLVAAARGYSADVPATFSSAEDVALYSRGWAAAQSQEAALGDQAAPALFHQDSQPFMLNEKQRDVLRQMEASGRSLDDLDQIFSVEVPQYAGTLFLRKGDRIVAVKEGGAAQVLSVDQAKDVMHFTLDARRETFLSQAQLDRRASEKARTTELAAENALPKVFEYTGAGSHYGQRFIQANGEWHREIDGKLYEIGRRKGDNALLVLLDGAGRDLPLIGTWEKGTVIAAETLPPDEQELPPEILRGVYAHEVRASLRKMLGSGPELEAGMLLWNAVHGSNGSPSMTHAMKIAQGFGADGHGTSDAIIEAVAGKLWGVREIAQEKPSMTAGQATAEVGLAALGRDDVATAMTVIEKARGSELERIGNAVGFRRQYQEGVNAYRDRLLEVVPSMTRTARETAHRERQLFDRMSWLAVEFDRMSNWTGVPEGSYDGKWLTHVEAKPYLVAELNKLESAPDYAKIAAMVRNARPGIFNAAGELTLEGKTEAGSFPEILTFADMKAMVEQVSSLADLNALNDAVEKRVWRDQQPLTLTDAEQQGWTVLIAEKAAQFEDSGCEQVSALPAWHTALPGAGLPMEAKDDSVDGYRIVPGRIALEAVAAITHEQKMNGGKMYAYVLPAADGNHGRLRLVPDDQEVSADTGWKLVTGEGLRVGMMTQEQLVTKLADWLRREPVIGDRRAAPAKSAEEAIRKAFEARKDRTDGMVVPLRVEFNGASQEFLAVGGKLASLADQRRGLNSPVHLSRLYAGRLLKDSPREILFQAYTLNGRDVLKETGLPRSATEDDLKRWAAHGLAVPSLEAKSLTPAVGIGPFIGTVVAVADGKVMQDVGRGQVVSHDVDRFEVLPVAGRMTQISYGKQGKATAREKIQETVVVQGR